MTPFVHQILAKVKTKKAFAWLGLAAASFTDQGAAENLAESSIINSDALSNNEFNSQLVQAQVLSAKSQEILRQLNPPANRVAQNVASDIAKLAMEMPQEAAQELVTLFTKSFSLMDEILGTVEAIKSNALPRVPRAAEITTLMTQSSDFRLHQIKIFLTCDQLHDNWDIDADSTNLIQEDATNLGQEISIIEANAMIAEDQRIISESEQLPKISCQKLGIETTLDPNELLNAVPSTVRAVVLPLLTADNRKAHRVAARKLLRLKYKEPALINLLTYVALQGHGAAEAILLLGKVGSKGSKVQAVFEKLARYSNLPQEIQNALGDYLFEERSAA